MCNLFLNSTVLKSFILVQTQPHVLIVLLIPATFSNITNILTNSLPAVIITTRSKKPWSFWLVKLELDFVWNEWKGKLLNDWWINQSLLLYKQVNMLNMCALRCQAISESAVLFGPVLLQTLGPRAELAYPGSAVPPSWWPQPAASGEHTGGCSYTEGSGWSLHVEPPCTGCPPVSGLPWSPAYFERWIFLAAGHLEGCPQIPRWPSGEHQSKAGNALIGRMVDALLCHCRTQRRGFCCQPEQWRNGTNKVTVDRYHAYRTTRKALNPG